MSSNVGSYCYVLATIIFTVYGQLVIKWQVGGTVLPVNLTHKVWTLLGFLLNPWIISGFFSAFLAALCWMAAMTKLPLSEAYPWMSLAFVSVLLLSPVLIGESISFQKIAGTGLIMIGIFVISR